MRTIEVGESAVLINEVSCREPDFTATGITAPFPLSAYSEADQSEWLAAGGREEYVFPKLRVYDETMPEVRRLIDDGCLKEAVDLTLSCAIKSFEEKSPSEKWSHYTRQLPGDWGPHHPTDREHMRKTLTSKARGLVMEAMCGFTSYVDEAPHIDEVVAMDFCRDGLELYDYPDRRRILFDLDTIATGCTIDFLSDNALDTICISFGVDYLKDPLAVYSEFGRVLSPGGRVLVIGGRSCGYSDLIKQYFDPVFHVGLLAQAGFVAATSPLPYGGQGDEAAFHLIEAVNI